MSYAYNKHKERRRHSKRKNGHQLREGQHKRRLSFSEKLRSMLMMTARREQT